MRALRRRGEVRLESRRVLVWSERRVALCERRCGGCDVRQTTLACDRGGAGEVTSSSIALTHTLYGLQQSTPHNNNISRPSTPVPRMSAWAYSMSGRPSVSLAPDAASLGTGGS